MSASRSFPGSPQGQRNRRQGILFYPFDDLAPDTVSRKSNFIVARHTGVENRPKCPGNLANASLISNVPEGCQLMETTHGPKPRLRMGIVLQWDVDLLRLHDCGYVAGRIPARGGMLL